MAEMQPSRLLKMWLGSMYQADVLKRGSYDEARALVTKRLRADQSLRDEAESLRASLKPVVRARPHAYVEKKTLEYLDALLVKENIDG